MDIESRKRVDLVCMVAKAIQPKFAGFGGLSASIAEEIAYAAVDAMWPTIEAFTEQAFDRGQISGASPHDGSWPKTD